jgi:hypothetical protein
MSKNTIANGQGQCALEDWRIELMQDAFREGGLLDLEPVKVGEGWQVSVSDDRGNALAIVSLPSEKEAKRIIGLIRLRASMESFGFVRI